MLGIKDPNSSDKTEEGAELRPKLTLKMGAGKSESVDLGHSSRPRLAIKKKNVEETLSSLGSGVEKEKKTKFFYKVKNHQELFKLGSSFYNDYQSGIRSFAIGSTGYQASQQRSILGLASFFDHKYDVKIAIISDNLYDGVFKEIVESSREEVRPIDGHGANCKVHSFHNHFEFVDLESLLQQSNQDSSVDYDARIREFTRKYDIIFWDVPELYKIKEDPEVYYPMIMMFDSLSLIVAKSLTSTEEVKDVTSFFMAYGINLKGLVFDHGSGESQLDKAKSQARKALKAVKKPWWRIFKK